MYGPKMFFSYLIFGFVAHILGISFAPWPKQGEETLRLVFAVFRHGERIPDSPPYPLDPYKNLTWFPYGYGHLTNQGKRREYKIGKSLRQAYDRFLGDLYYDGILKARSSSYDRTKNSLQLVLAGLFPPCSMNQWSENDDVAKIWQPIAFDYKPATDDPEILGLFCESYAVAYEKYMNTNDYTQKIQKYSRLFQFLEGNTGIKPFNQLNTVHQLFYTLASQEAYGLTLPDWAKWVYPDEMLKALVDAYLAGSGTAELRKFTAGFLLKQMIDEIKARQAGILDKGRKIYLFSGHEINIAHLMITLNIFYPHSPSFGAYLVFEVHERYDGQYFIRVFHQNYESKNPRPKSIPGCGVDCNLEKLVALLGESIPGPLDTCSNKIV